MEYLQQRENHMLLYVYIQPAAKNNAWVGEYGGRLKIKLTAQPVDGHANAALCTWLAKELDCCKRDISIVHGENSRQKVICLQNASERYNEINRRIMKALNLCQ